MRNGFVYKYPQIVKKAYSFFPKHNLTEIQFRIKQRKVKVSVQCKFTLRIQFHKIVSTVPAKCIGGGNIQNLDLSKVLIPHFTSKRPALEMLLK